MQSIDEMNDVKMVIEVWGIKAWWHCCQYIVPVYCIVLYNILYHVMSNMFCQIGFVPHQSQNNLLIVVQIYLFVNERFFQYF